MRKRLVIGFLLILLFSTYKPQNLYLSSKFVIKEIEIDNNIILKDKEIKKDLIFLYNTNLISLNTLSIKNVLKKNSFIDSFEIKKIYPNKIKIKIFEKKPIGIIKYNKIPLYIDENFELIEFINHKNFNNLPEIFGDKGNFEVFYNNLKKMNFPLSLIKKYYLHESIRWDLETYNNKTIKLPSEDYVKSLKNFIDLKKKNDFDKYTIFDYRINNQLILK